jgi:4'-phosphopantetheinyl transferase
MLQNHGLPSDRPPPLDVVPAGRVGLADLTACPAMPQSSGPGEAAVWHLVCPPARPVPGCFREVLDAAERARADRFRRERDRRLFTLAHGALRYILAAQTGLDPASITYALSDRGKPFLAGGGPQFNLSHAGDGVLVAVCAGAPVGVDLEPLRPLAGAEALVERFFAVEEGQAFLAWPPPRRAEAFFTIWTRKEAYVKALGGGLAIPLGAFAVSLDGPARLIRPLPGAPFPGPRLCDLPAPAGYVGALAGWCDRVVCRELDLPPS